MRREAGMEYFDELNAELTAHASSFDKYSCYDDDEDYACHPPKMVDDLIEYRDKFYGALYGILDKYQQHIEADIERFLTPFRRNWDKDDPARIFKHGYHYLAVKSVVKFLNAVAGYFLFLNDKSETHFESFTNYLKHGFSDCITAEELDLIERTQTAMAKRKHSILKAAQDIQAILNEAVIRRFRKGLDEFAEKLTEIGDHCLAGRVRLEIDLLKQIK